MSWQPISKEELEALIDEGLRDADDDVLSAWASMRIEPTKWQCSPWGDEGGGFWVVAIRNGMVTWYNDIEEGFNESPFVKEGTISEYGCNQDAFGQYLQRIPEARNEAKWSRLQPSTSIPNRLKCPGQVIRRQTTSWTIKTASGERWRIHFLNKVEFGFSESPYSTLTVSDNHPLLAQYSEPWFELYFLGIPNDPEVVTTAMASAVAEATEGWRRFDNYVNRSAPLSGGYGSLMRAPQTVIQAVEAVLANTGAKTKTIDCTRPAYSYQVLLLDKSFVIAEDFRFEPLESSK
ncbi:MAG: hypothetical protein KF890_14225 [Nitrospira sp.]|nr:hypothetical protein [Nitrospira sp.]